MEMWYARETICRYLPLQQCIPKQKYNKFTNIQASTLYTISSLFDSYS